MRIVGGSAKSRVIRVPKGRDTRPMTEETREALFNILGSVEGLNLLDAYAGSGAIGLEAISRGAAHVDGIEKSREAVSIIRKNVKELGFEDSYEVWQTTVEAWIKKHEERIGKYDLIFADPPFTELKTEILMQLVQFLELSGLFILKSDARRAAPDLKGAEIAQTRKYGDSLITFYKLS